MLGLSPDWQVAREFVMRADLADSGEAVAREVFGYSLATAAEAITGVANAVPDSKLWTDDPFGGGFSLAATVR